MRRALPHPRAATRAAQPAQASQVSQVQFTPADSLRELDGHCFTSCIVKVSGAATRSLPPPAQRNYPNRKCAFPTGNDLPTFCRTGCCMP